MAKKFKPHKYQLKAFKFCIKRFLAGLFLDPGLGKTSIMLMTISYLFKEGLINRVLIVAPLNVCYNTWPDEIEKWLDFNHLTYSILHGTKKDDAYQDDTHIHIINPEGRYLGMTRLPSDLGWSIYDGKLLNIDRDEETGARIPTVYQIVPAVSGLKYP